MKLPLATLIATVSFAQTWIAQTSGTTASLRGVSAVGAKVVWASGAEGTWLKTLDGGATWQAGHIANTDPLDFRAIRAIDENTAYLMSIGPGDKSRVYKTTDGGRKWTLLFTNPDTQGFFDGIAFWNPSHGILMGDPVDGHIVIMTTNNGGEHWSRQKTPDALPKEGAFAASNTSLVVRGDREVWFATGGPGAARVFHSTNGGVTWTAAHTPIRNDSPSAGIFSLAFSSARRGMAVGGDYAHDKESQGNIASTSDAGATWTAPGSPHGYRSAIAYLSDLHAWIATGTSGSDLSLNDGATWKQFDDGPFNAISAISSKAAWAVGPKGKIAKLSMTMR